MTEDPLKNDETAPIGNRQSAIGNQHLSPMTEDPLKNDETSPIGNRQSAIGNVMVGNRQSAIGDALRRYVRTRTKPAETCDMCSMELGPVHPHLVEPATRRLVCACQACAILFSNAAETKYRRVPQRVRYLANFQLSDAQWEGLMIPINMAFFFQSSAVGKVIVLYPSPAGATESLLEFESWKEIVESNPVLRDMEPDTEALLVNRVQRASDHFIVPIDECYRLVGLIRMKWKGLAGGTEVWEAINSFFAELRERATVVAEVARA